MRVILEFFARRLYEVLRLEKSLDVTKKTYRNREMFLLKLHIVQGMLIAVMLGFMLYFLIYLYGEHLIGVGDFALVLGISMDVGYMTWFTMEQLDEFNKAVGKCKQSLSCIIVKHEIKDKQAAEKLAITNGEITFSKVRFHYKGGKTLFENKSITIKPGEKLGLVGYSGSGKTTFVNLVLRLYDVTAGKILIDGQNIVDVTQDSLHHGIAMIPQAPSLFHRTILENIRYGRIEASDDEVIAAAKKAHAHDFIVTLQEGYASLVGERGIKLSGGQRQRIAIARAILKNSPILILDEATSQLDSVTENLIQQSLWQLMQQKNNDYYRTSSFNSLAHGPYSGI